MSRRGHLWVVACLVALAVRGARAQDLSTLPPPVADRPPAYVLPPVEPIRLPDRPQPDPLLDRPEGVPPGPFVNVDLAVLAPHLRNQLRIAVPTPVGGGFDTVSFPGNPLDVTVSPRFEFGYRLPDGWGALEAHYRFLATRGVDRADAPDETFAVGGVFDANILDVGYASQEFSLGPHWDMRWEVGVRFANIYFNSHARSAAAGPMPGDVLEQDETNRVYGIGGYAGVEVGYRLPWPGWTVFGRFEGAELVSRLRQTGTEVVLGAAGPVGSSASQDGFPGIGMLMERVGLSYEPPGWNHGRFLIGYQYETWFQVGRIEPSNGQFDAQGLFLRAEFNY